MIPFNIWEEKNREDIAYLHDKYLSNLCSYINFSRYCYTHSTGTGNYNKNKRQWCFKAQREFVDNLREAIDNFHYNEYNEYSQSLKKILHKM